jgi:monoterpene epsilon-lactone hydrolase
MSESAQVWHPLVSSDVAVRARLREALAPSRGKMRGPEARPVYDAVMDRIGAAPDVSYQQATIRDVAGWWCLPSAAERGSAILYLHGGWFILGSAEGYRHFVSHIAAQTQTAIFIPDYRLAPEHTLPAAIDDARDVYDGLAEDGWIRIAVAGDSAGGALTLELLASLTQRPAPVSPKAAVLFSPVTDLTLSGETWVSREQADLLFTKEQIQHILPLYLGTADPASALASPLNQDLRGLPTLRIHTGDDEVLLSDSVRLADRAKAAGVNVQLNVREGMLHGFATAIDAFEASRTALDDVATFMRAQLH